MLNWSYLFNMDTSSNVEVDVATQHKRTMWGVGDNAPNAIEGAFNQLKNGGKTVSMHIHNKGASGKRYGA